MLRIALIFGGLSGAVIITAMILGLTLAGDAGGGSELVGYLIMLIALTLIFVGVKQYRDRDLGGVIKFSQAFLTGLSIAAVAAIVYVAIWEVYLTQTGSAFIDQYTTGVIEAKKEQGVTGEELEKLTAKMDEMRDQYANPMYRIPITFLEIFPVGLIVALVAAALLRNEKFMPRRL